MRRIIRPKRFLIGFTVLCVLVAGGGYVLFSNTYKTGDKQKITTPEPNSSKTSPKTVELQKQDLPKPPAPPAICSELKASVDQTLKAESSLSGREEKNEGDNKYRDCTYIKDSLFVNIRIFEYPNESTAKSALQKEQTQGRAVQNKGKFNVVIVSADDKGANIAVANQLIKVVTDKL